uniref:Protein tweety homolog n=1 Tax=Syphacia muris TaxID=451379 RepID=A0A0N5B0S7_9BILA
MFLIILVGVGIVLKFWALSVVLFFYRHVKYLSASSRLAVARYTNAQGIHMNANELAFSMDVAYNNANIYPTTEPHSGIDYPPLPSYENVMQQDKSRNESNTVNS